MRKLALLLALAVAATQSGCVLAFSQASMRKKLPKVNATNVHLEIGTIYGVSGSIDAAKIFTGKTGIQTFTGYMDRLDTPLGHIKVSFDKISFRDGVPVEDPEATPAPDPK